MRHIWTYERFINNQWMPVYQVWSTRLEARYEKNYWNKNDPKIKRRIRKYIPEDEIKNYIMPSGKR